MTNVTVNQATLDKTEVDATEEYARIKKEALRQRYLKLYRPLLLKGRADQGMVPAVATPGELDIVDAERWAKDDAKSFYRDSWAEGSGRCGLIAGAI